MFLGQALLYVVNDPFIVKCEENTILNIKPGREEMFSSRHDERLQQSNILNTEVFRITAKDDKVVFHI